jgi:hypothetical protein
MFFRYVCVLSGVIPAVVVVLPKTNRNKVQSGREVASMVEVEDSLEMTLCVDSLIIVNTNIIKSIFWRLRL